jgi:hypothetical protein
MGRHIVPVIHWMEQINMQPAAREERACCLEPNELLFVRLTADDPFDAALVDWDAYQTWAAHGADDMPTGGQFANDTRSIDWEGRSEDLPYIMVLVIFNPGKRANSIDLEVEVSAVPEQRSINSAGRSRDVATARDR